MADREIEAVIDDETFTIGYNMVDADDFSDYDTYAELTHVFDSNGNSCDIDSNEHFYRKCENIANEELQEYLYYFEADE